MELCCCPIKECHEDLLYQWRNTGALTQYFRHKMVSRAAHREWMVNQPHDPVTMFVFHTAEDGVIGVGGLTPIDWDNRHGELSFYVGKDNLYIDDDYAPKILQALVGSGFRYLNLHRLWAEVFDFDSKKAQLLERHGFVKETTVSQHYYRDGRYVDAIRYGLLRSEA